MNNLNGILAEYDRLSHGGKTIQAGDFLRQQLRIITEPATRLTLLNELIGHYRMAGDEFRGISAVEEALDLMKELQVQNSVSSGTIRLNAATALHSFGKNSEALQLYRQAYADYSANLPENDPLFAGCFNNMAAVYATMGDLDTAEAYYMQALEIQNVSGNKMDIAVTWVNLAQLGRNTGYCLDKAWEYFNDESVKHDGYYAHSCAKCAGAFGILGRPGVEAELRRRAKEFYERD